MIRIVILTDKNRIIGTSDANTPQNLIEALPDDVGGVLQELYRGQNVAGGEAAWLEPTKGAFNNRYVITRNRKFNVGDEPVMIVDEAFDLVAKFKYSDDELVIVGGLAMFRVFTPHAAKLDIIELNESMGGNVEYRTWEDLDFELTASEVLKDCTVYHYDREV